MPGGTLAQPSFARRARDSPCWSPRRRTSWPPRPSAGAAGMASDQAHSQLPRLPRPVSGARAKPTLSATVRFLRVGRRSAAATVASIHMPHLPCWNSARFSLKPLEEAPGGPYVVHQVDVEVERRLPFRLVELRLPVLVEPARAEGVRPWRSGRPCSRPSRPCRAGRCRRCRWRGRSSCGALADDRPRSARRAW